VGGLLTATLAAWAGATVGAAGAATAARAVVGAGAAGAVVGLAAVAGAVVAVVAWAGALVGAEVEAVGPELHAAASSASVSAIANAGRLPVPD